MILSKKHIDRLEKKGLEISFYDGKAQFCKHKNTEGNFIVQWRNDPEAMLECPIIAIKIEDGQYVLTQWEWAPGPGPGDFSISFDAEENAVDFIDSYYFGHNKYFEERKAYEQSFRDSWNMKEVEQIVQAVLAKLFKEFGEDEFSIDALGIFLKIPIDKWRSTDYKEDHPIVETDLGFLPLEASELRDKLQKKEAFDYTDIGHVANLLFGLSVLIKEKNEEKKCNEDFVFTLH